MHSDDFENSILRQAKAESEAFAENIEALAEYERRWEQLLRREQLRDSTLSAIASENMFDVLEDVEPPIPLPESVTC